MIGECLFVIGLAVVACLMIWIGEKAWQQRQ